MFAKRIRTFLVAISLACPAIGSAAELDLNNPFYFTYGNVNVYSLPILATLYDSIFHTGTGPGNPYYVVSTPGAIKDLVVVYTGSNGTGVTTNTSGFEDAYGAPNGTVAFATTAPTGMTAPDPNTGKTILNQVTSAWDASVGALQDFLGTGATPVFLFNNNDTNQDQNLAIWAKLWITDPNNNLYGQYLYLSNEMQQYGQGGVAGGNALTYNPGPLTQPGVTLPPPNLLTDYVLAGGTVCLDAVFTIVPCSGPHTYLINHNLGANQVAYAGQVPLLNTYLSQISGLGNADDYTMHIELFLGCDPRIGVLTCTNFKIDNGFEQLFIASTGQTFDNPEPNSVALVALALLGLGGVSWRSARRKG